MEKKPFTVITLFGIVMTPLILEGEFFLRQAEGVYLTFHSSLEEAVQEARNRMISMAAIHSIKEE